MSSQMKFTISILKKNKRSMRRGVHQLQTLGGINRTITNFRAVNWKQTPMSLIRRASQVEVSQVGV